MSGDNAFTPAQYAHVERAIQIAEAASGLSFAAFIGGLPQGRASAIDMLMQLPRPESSVVVAVDPEQRSVDVVTGAEAQRWLDNSRCSLAVATMTTRFVVGDLIGGLHDGIVQLGQKAGRPAVLFTDEPA